MRVEDIQDQTVPQINEEENLNSLIENILGSLHKTKKWTLT